MYSCTSFYKDCVDAYYFHLYICYTITVSMLTFTGQLQFCFCKTLGTLCHVHQSFLISYKYVILLNYKKKIFFLLFGNSINVYLFKQYDWYILIHNSQPYNSQFQFPIHSSSTFTVFSITASTLTICQQLSFTILEACSISNVWFYNGEYFIYYCLL